MARSGIYSAASAINNPGQVVGSSLTSSDHLHAFLYSNGTMMDLGTLGGLSSGARDINNLGQVVGGALTSAGNLNAFLHANGIMTDLNSLIDPSLNITLSEAYAINNVGKILTIGPVGQNSLLTPVPEPSAWLLCLGGLLAFSSIRRWRWQTPAKTG